MEEIRHLDNTIKREEKEQYNLKKILQLEDPQEENVIEAVKNFTQKNIRKYHYKKKRNVYSTLRVREMNSSTLLKRCVFCVGVG